MAKYNYNLFQYFEASKRSIIAQPLNLGGITSSGGGTGEPPGGFIGMLPQTRVTYDWDEFDDDGFVQAGAVNPSGVVVSASLLDNLNHIRYRISILEPGGSNAGVNIYDTGVLVASGITILDIHGALNITDVGGGEVEIENAGIFIAFPDTPNTYSGSANKYTTVKNDETGLEFTTIVLSGVDHKVKVSSNDTTEGYLEDKVVGGTNVVVNTLNDGGNEDVEVTLSGVSLDGHTHLESEITDIYHDAESIQGVTVSDITPNSDEVLTFDGADWIPEVLPAGSTATRVIGFGYATTLSGGLTLPVKMHAPWAGTITNITATVSVAPAGSGIIIDINKNGTTIFTTQGNRPTIAAGTYEDLSSVPDVTNLTLNDVLTCDIDQVGTSPGAGLVVQVRIDL